MKISLKNKEVLHLACRPVLLKHIFLFSKLLVALRRQRKGIACPIPLTQGKKEKCLFLNLSTLKKVATRLIGCGPRLSYKGFYKINFFLPEGL
jgi:hypothetical protein